MKSWTSLSLLAGMMLIPSAFAEERVLFEFEAPEAVRSWRTVNDGVMGGRSSGRVRINDERHLEFSGTLSLANNGGFASVRARGTNLAMNSDDVIVARVRGDGREYKFNLYTQRNLGGYSFRQSFQTKKDEWIEVRLPVKNSVATWRGRVNRRERLDPSRVSGLGFLLGDKKPGQFQLEVAWIKVVSETGDDERREGN